MVVNMLWIVSVVAMYLLDDHTYVVGAREVGILPKPKNRSEGDRTFVLLLIEVDQKDQWKSAVAQPGPRTRL